MAKQTINPGTAPTGAGGDTFRSGSAKLQANDDEIYNYLGDGTNLNKLGTAAFKNTGTQAGNVMEVGAFGLGSTARLSSANSYAELDASLLKPTQMVGFSNTGVVGYGQGLSWSTNNRLHAVIGDLFAARLFHVCLADVAAPIGSRQITYALIRTEANTTVDANGFLKNASPIVKLFADKIESNNEAQLQDIAFEKLGVGDYLIKGSSGFAPDGWYIETPKDANGNVLFSVIYTTLENGDISVKTYKKKFDFETVSIVADLDNPVDITENRWIDLRLQELPQPEIEMPESITPPDFQPTGLAQAVATVMESYHDTEQ